MNFGVKFLTKNTFIYILVVVLFVCKKAHPKLKLVQDRAI